MKKGEALSELQTSLWLISVVLFHDFFNATSGIYDDAAEIEWVTVCPVILLLVLPRSNVAESCVFTTQKKMLERGAVHCMFF